MKKIIFRILMWIIWKRFQKDMEKFIGYKSLDVLNNDLKILENEIRNNNNIPIGQNITWENSRKTERSEFARLYTYQHFFQQGIIIKNAKLVPNRAVSVRR